MTTPQSLTEERIDGEFHYAKSGETGFTVYRSDDGVFVEHHSIVIGRPLDRSDMERELALCDGTARHFIEAERERVNDLAANLADHTQDLIASSPGQEQPLWTVYGLHDYEDGTTGATFIEALESAANPSSPDLSVLGEGTEKTTGVSGETVVGGERECYGGTDYEGGVPVAGMEADARVADTVTVGAWNKPPVIGYGSVYFYAVPAKHPHEWAIRRHGELQPVAFADSTDEAEDLVGLLESTAEYFMELSAQNSIREVDKAGLVAAMIPRALAESIVSHTFTKITPREGAAIYEDACRQALAATREQTAEVTTSDASEPSVSALKETFGGPANCSKCEAPIMAGGSCHNCQKPNPEPGAGPYKRDGKMVEGPETLTPFSTEGDAVRALDLANAAYLAGQASTPEKPGLAVALDRMEKEADKWAKTPTEQTNCISVAAALRIHAEAIRELDKTAANLTPSPVPQGACPECQGPMIEIGMGNDPVCRQSVVTCPTAELAWSAKLTANHTPAVPLSGSVEGQTDKDYADRKRSGSATDPSIPDEPTAADDFTMGDGSLADKMDQRAFVRGEGKYAANQHTPTQSTESVRGGWRAIESAPKDGTLVLIFDEKVDVYMASWINQSGLHPTPGWIDAEGDPCEPTHWMPLPSPPTTEPDPKAPRLGGEA